MAFTRDLPAMKKFDFPKYEVITPHTKHSFLIRSMTVNQENVLKESSVSASRALSIVNQTLFDCIEDKEAPFNTLEGFEQNLTMVDRTALIYGLIIATYGETQKLSYTCPNCGNRIEVEVNIPENTTVSMYEGNEPIITRRDVIELPVSKYKVVLGVPTLKDEKIFSLSKGVSKEVMNKVDDYLIVKKLIVPGTETSATGTELTQEYSIDNIFDIYTTVCQLPARDRKAIYNTWSENFGDYGVKVNIPIVCTACRTENESRMNVVEELFRQLS